MPAVVDLFLIGFLGELVLCVERRVHQQKKRLVTGEVGCEICNLILVVEMNCVCKSVDLQREQLNVIDVQDDQMSSTIQTTSSSPSVTEIGFDPHLVRYGSIFLLTVGTFGNVVSFFIFSYGTLRKSSTFRYLALLSIMDLLVLYSGLLDLFLMVEYGEEFSLRILHPITCRLHTFITYWSQHSSSWILSFISVDRAVATNCIKFARKFCTPRSASYIVTIILVLMALFNCHELIFIRLQDTDLEKARIDQTTYRPNAFTQETGLVNHISANKRDLQSILSICDTNSHWNFLCLRNKRDLPVANVTIQPKSKSAGRICEALKGSRYHYVWDHVWEWIDVCLYAFIPFTVMSVGTFLIVYRVYYQQRRVFRSRRSGAQNGMGATPNKAKSLFYLLFTLNLLYFILVTPVVLVTTMLFGNRVEEVAYPRLKTIVYLMQYCNHSLNFIFYGITSPPYRRTLCEWFASLIPHLPQCCQRTIRERSKSIALQNNLPLRRKTVNDGMDRPVKKELSSLIPR